MKQIYTLMFVAVTMIAQAQNKGRIYGSVADDYGNLPGAIVRIDALSIGTSTDLQGTFNFTNLPAGDYTLTFSYIGHQEITKTVTIVEGQAMNLGQVMFLNEGKDNELEGIVITSYQAPSQAKAFSIQKNAAGIMNVIATDNIGKLPDRNAAEAVQRISGVSLEKDHGEGRYVSVRGTPLQWNSTLINGTRMPTSEGTSDGSSGTRTSPLDVFPSEMIEYIQLSKAITPDIEGDAIGGSVNFITKTAPTKQTLQVSAGGGYNDQARKGSYTGSFLYGDKVADGKIGFVLGGSYWKRNWGTDNLEMTYDIEDKSIDNLQLRDYNGVRRTAGLNGGFEYQINDNHKLYARGIYTDFQDDERAIEGTYEFAKGSYMQRTRRGVTGISLYGAELGGAHESHNGMWKLDWKGGGYATDMETRNPSGSKAKNKAYQMAFFESDVNYTNLAPDGKMYLDIDAPQGYIGASYKHLKPTTTQEIHPNMLGLDMLYAMQTQSYERDWLGEFNLEYKPSEKVKIKAGGKFKTKYLERGAPFSIYSYTGKDPLYMGSLDLQSFPHNGGFLTELGDTYKTMVQPGITFNQLDRLFTKENLNNGSYYPMVMDAQNPSSAASFYNGTEDVYAGYVMGDVAVSDKFSIIGGLRYERTQLTYRGNKVIEKEDGTKAVESNKSSNGYNALLPMIHFKYQVQDNMNLRMAYTRTFARANFSDLNPTESVSMITTPYSISRGNINLKPTFSNNIDLLGEYFFDDIGIVNAGVFYKALENVIYSSQRYTTLNNQLYKVIQPENSKKGWLAGMELGLSKRLTFLPGFWSGFGIDANYTYTHSEMDVPVYRAGENNETVESIEKQALPNQAKHLFNVALSYEKGKTAIRLAGNYKGKSLALIQGNPENYRWYDKNFTVDLSAQYKLTDRLTIYVELNNLTNEPMRYFHGQSNRPEQVEYYSFKGMMGINFNIL
ncbi:TonB-dependent receptor [Myroides odoratimimus]|uniref:TonB-dependent receptor n=1 Tax=Myroides odoratimimus TaxID=76832 RepID=UPI003100B141